MIDLAAALEATSAAQVLKQSRWLYPLVNAAHIFGLALLVGSIVPMDVALLRGRTEGTTRARLWAAGGLALAALSGAALFVTQAGDYLRNPWFGAKMALLALALLNVALHLRLLRLSRRAQVRAALASLLLWPAVLLLGRLVGYS